MGGIRWWSKSAVSRFIAYQCRGMRFRTGVVPAAGAHAPPPGDSRFGEIELIQGDWPIPCAQSKHSRSV